MTIKATLSSGEEQPAARSTYRIGAEPCSACGKRGCGGECGDRTPPLTDDAVSNHSAWRTHQKMADIEESERTGRTYW